MRRLRGKRTSACAVLLGSLVSVGLAAPVAAVEPTDSRPPATCGPSSSERVSDLGARRQRDPHHEFTTLELARIQAKYDGARRSSDRVLDINVPVRVHVIDGTNYRGPSRAEASEQLDILNEAYAGAQPPGPGADVGITFFEKSFERVRNQSWLTASVRSDGSPDAASKQMRRELHQGGPGHLNIYYSKPSGNLLGYSSFPWDVDSDLPQDGVTVHTESMMGGNISGYNRGDTLVHEVGHWLGLFHTFQGGCFGDGDYVADTPKERDPNLQCPASRDTCAAPGADPIHNFMDYSFDTCMYLLTNGQAARVENFWGLRTP